MRKICLALIMAMLAGIIPCSAAETNGDAIVGETLTVSGIEETQYPEFGAQRVEAENMFTLGYDIMTNENASGGKYIKSVSDGRIDDVWCVAGFKYKGKTLKGSLDIVYPDFYSGSSPKHLYINGKRIAMWSGKLTYGKSIWGTKPEYTKDVIKTKTIRDIMLRDGDIITFVSKHDYGEYGELDYIEIKRNGTVGDDSEITFSDTKGDANEEKINTLLSEGILTIGTDRRFNPQNAITGEQFLVMLLRMLGYKNITTDKKYWANNYLEKAVMHGYINADDKLNKNISADEIKKIINAVEYIDYIPAISGNTISRSKAAGLIYDMREELEKGKAQNAEQKEEYNLDSQGYIGTWLYTGIVATYAYKNLTDARSVMSGMKNYPMGTKVPDNENFSLTLDNGMDFNVLPMGGSGFINDLSRGGENKSAENVGYVCCDVISPKKMSVRAKITGSRGYYDIYCDGKYVTDLLWLYSRSTTKEFTLNLQEGINRIFVRVQNLDSNIMTTNFGIQFLDNRDILKTTVPAQKEVLAAIEREEKWAYAITVGKNGELKATSQPGEGAIVLYGGVNYDWPLYSDTFDFEKEIGKKITTFKIKTKVGENYLEREVELPQNYEIVRTDFKTLQEHQANYRKVLIERDTNDWDWSQLVLIRLNEGYPLTELDISRIRLAVDRVNVMADCAEFAMAGVMRLYLLYGDKLPSDLVSEIKACILNFAYFNDEEGAGAMVMTSENHKLGFHTCQYIAGMLYPDEIFKRSGRTGKEQKEIGRARLDERLSIIEEEGFHEFNSASYDHVTVNALLNAYDFIDDTTIKQRVKVLLDLYFRTQAIASFDGVSVGANARSYMDARIYPAKSSKTMTIGYLSPSINVSEYHTWNYGLITTSYTPPADLEELITGDVDMSFLQGGTKLTVKKTKDYIISSLNVPTPATGSMASDYVKGILMYHSNMWEASVGANTKTFVTHPGTTRESSNSSPGYWNGEFTCPVIKQEGSTVMEIYNIPETNSIQFTHAYFTTDTFDEVKLEDNWLFGRKNDGYIALWCSTPLEKRSDLTINMEYVADNTKAAWVCTASSKDESGGFEEFVAAQKAKNPTFDETKLKLTIDGEEVLSW